MFYACLLMAMCLGAAESDTAKIEARQIAPRIEHVTFHSDVLGKGKAMSVVLPEQYETDGRDWPMLLFLHGRGRHERSLVDDEGARQALLAAPFVVVLPDGDDGWYINAPAIPADRYEAYTQEVLAVAKKRYRISSERRLRGIAGWSMGGYGATRFAQRHAKDFGALASIIGLLDFPRTGLPSGQQYSIPFDRFGKDPEVWKQLNPIQGADQLAGMDLLVITADEAFDRTMNENFAQKLRDLDIPFAWRQLRGGHTFDVVRQSVPLVIEMMARSFQNHVTDASAA